MQGGEGRTSLVVEIGGCSVAVEGPLDSALPLLEYLRAYQPGVSSGYPSGLDPNPRTPSRSPNPLQGPASIGFSPQLPVRASSTRFTAPSAAASSPPSPCLSAPLASSARAPSCSTGPAVQDPLPGDLPIQGDFPTRSSLEASLPACPADWLAKGTALTAAGTLSGKERVRRAWRAGAWARLVLEGSVGIPSASQPLAIPSRYYVVLGGEGHEPCLYRSYRDFSQAVGPLPGSTAVCHGFPSELEAKAYTCAAGLVWPLPSA